MFYAKAACPASTNGSVMIYALLDNSNRRGLGSTPGLVGLFVCQDY